MPAHQDDLAPRGDAFDGTAALARELDRDRSAVLDHDAGDVKTTRHEQIGTRQRREQEGAARAGTAPALDIDLVAADALLHGAVEIGGERIAGLLSGAQEVLVYRESGNALAHRQRPALAMKGGVRPGRSVLRPAKQRQHVVIAPAGEAELAPAIEIAGIAADIEHPVDRRGTTPALASRHEHPPAAKPLDRLGFEPPVAGVGCAHQRRHAGGHGREQAVVPSAGFDQRHEVAGIGAQPVGDDAAGRAGADDDVIRLGGKRSDLGHQPAAPTRRRSIVRYETIKESSAFRTQRYEPLCHYYRAA